ncbi:MAG: sugar nucleotide-binding protein [Candidatus Riflebacteria bacterium]|nr:sugar nucleotide-binding protein [Candidatus Riflebacteria bacterium]
MIADQVGGPTWTRGLARNVAALVARAGGRDGGENPATAKGGHSPDPATGEGRPGPGDVPSRQPPPPFGIYHYSDAGHISWHEFAVGIREEALAAGAIERSVPIEAIPTAAYPLPAPRPANSRFAHDKVRDGLGFTVAPWRDHLAAFFAEWKAAGFPM